MPYSSSMTSAKIWNLWLNLWMFLSGTDRVYLMYVWMYACDYCFYSCFSRDSEPAVTALASKYCKLLPYETEVHFVCMYVCMYVVNMCTLYEITNVWNELGCLQPPLPLRRRHQHPDLPWWVLHSLVCWVYMLGTYILVCKYVCEYDVILKYLLTTFMLVRRWRCKSLRSWKPQCRK